MLTEERTVQQTPRQPELGWRWWVVTGLTGLVAIGLGGFVASVLGFDLDGTWVADLVVWIPLILAGLATGYVGGVRRWWLLIPTAAAPLVWLGVVVGEGEVYPAISGFGYWSLLIGTTVIVTVVASRLIRRLTRMTPRTSTSQGGITPPSPGV